MDVVRTKKPLFVKILLWNPVPTVEVRLTTLDRAFTSSTVTEVRVSGPSYGRKEPVRRWMKLSAGLVPGGLLHFSGLVLGTYGFGSERC